MIASVPILMILTHRPGYKQPLGERAHFSRMALGHLAPEDSQAMAGQRSQGTLATASSRS